MSKWIKWTVAVGLSALYYYAYTADYLTLLAVDKSYISYVVLVMGWIIVVGSAVMSVWEWHSKQVYLTMSFLNDRLPQLGLISTVYGLYIATVNGIPTQEVMLVALGTALIPTGLASLFNILGDAILGNHNG